MSKFADLIDSIESNSIFLEAKQVGELYHFTTIPRAIQILKSGAIKIPSERSQRLVGAKNYGFEKYISLTRSKYLLGVVEEISEYGIDDEIFRAHVRIAIDGDKLSTSHKITPIMDRDPSAGIIRQDPLLHEAEEAVKKDIPIKYIKRIDIINAKREHAIAGNPGIDYAAYFDPESKKKWLSQKAIDMYEQKKSELIKLAKQKGIKINTITKFKEVFRKK